MRCGVRVLLLLWAAVAAADDAAPEGIGDGVVGSLSPDLLDSSVLNDLEPVLGGMPDVSDAEVEAWLERQLTAQRGALSGPCSLGQPCDDAALAPLPDANQAPYWEPWEAPAGSEQSYPPLVEPACGLFWYFHIPKTGGMSIEQYLRVTQGRLTHTPYVRFHAGWHHAMPSLERFVDDEANTRELRFVGHHHDAPGLLFFRHKLAEWRHKLRLRGCQLLFGITVRDGFSRERSHLMYNRVPVSRWATVLKELQNDELQVRYVLNNYPSQPEALAIPFGRVTYMHVALCRYILERLVDIYGVTSHIEGFVSEVNRRLGLPDTPLLSRNRTPHKQSYIDQITPEIEAVVAERSRMDSELYAWCLSKSPWAAGEVPDDVPHFADALPAPATRGLPTHTAAVSAPPAQEQPPAELPAVGVVSDDAVGGGGG